MKIAPDRLRETTDIERAYLAGLIDGEGSIFGSWRGRAEFAVRLNICNTDRRMITWVASRYPGRQSDVDRSTYHQKTVYRFDADAGMARLILTDVLPYLVIKRRHAEIALLIPTLTIPNPGRAGYPEHLIVARRDLYDELRGLNRKGAA